MTTPIGGAGARHGLEDISAVSSGAEGEGAAAEAQGEPSSLAAAPRARPKSVNFGGANLAADLNARLDGSKIEAGSLDDEDEWEGPSIEELSKQVFERLEAVEGKGSRLMGALFDTTRTLDREVRKHDPERASNVVMGMIGSFTGTGSRKIGAHHVEDLVREAKDYKKITGKEFQVLGDFTARYAQSFEPEALRGLIAFLRKNAPASIMAEVDRSESVKAALR